MIHTMRISKMSVLVALALVACGGKGNQLGQGGGGAGSDDSGGTTSSGGSAGTSHEGGSAGTGDDSGSAGTSHEGGSPGVDTDLVDCRPTQVCGGATYPKCAIDEVLVTRWQGVACTVVCVKLTKCECNAATECPDPDLYWCQAGRCQPKSCPGCTPTDPP